ncbi:MAG: FKBP-type peptidyl-prolyl cis-trans isomerase [Bacteroidia bacterium]|nr:FKBP-type peptidyl-prolyl cis-trans isomerase [Bacteroidia bacterium]
MQGQTELEALSYALGLNVGNSLKGSGFEELDTEQFLKGLKEAMTTEVSNAQLQESNAVVQAFMKEKEAEKAKVMAKEGTEFLKENATKEGVVTLPSGLQYKVIKEGTGVKAVDGDQVTTHYTGRFVDGKVFDSSVERGQPATFGVNQVIAGWTEALKLMPEGSKWQLFIPYDLAYGTQGRPGIPAYSTLIFDIELIDVVGK